MGRNETRSNDSRLFLNQSTKIRDKDTLKLGDKEFHPLYDYENTTGIDIKSMIDETIKKHMKDKDIKDKNTKEV